MKTDWRFTPEGLARVEALIQRTHPGAALQRLERLREVATKAGGRGSERTVVIIAVWEGVSAAVVCKGRGQTPSDAAGALRRELDAMFRVAHVRSLRQG